MAILCKQICSSEAESTASRVELTIINIHINICRSGYAVVPGIKITVFNGNVFACGHMNSVMTCFNGYIIHTYIFRIENGM